MKLKSWPEFQPGGCFTCPKLSISSSLIKKIRKMFAIICVDVVHVFKIGVWVFFFSVFLGQFLKTWYFFDRLNEMQNNFFWSDSNSNDVLYH